MFAKDMLYGRPDRPRVVGKYDEEERPLLGIVGELDSDLIARAIARRLARKARIESVEARIQHLDELKRRPKPLTLARTAFFCSGCPHNRSTVVPEGAVAAAGIGCHGMAMGMDRGIIGVTHMGGEGAQWIGIAPFTETPHIFQNIGDGTFFHSGSLAINYAVASGVNITYKILYNAAVAMTGGQAAAGALADSRPDAPARGRGRQAHDPHHRRPRQVQGRRARGQRRGVAPRPPGRGAVASWPRLPASPCSSTTSSARRRSGASASAGKLADPDPARVHQRARVRGLRRLRQEVQLPERAAGGRPSSAGRRQIHQSSCNKDYSCLLGDCPSFLTVEPVGPPKKKEQAAARRSRTRCPSPC